MIRLYAYKCIHDDGGAPCVEAGVLSLCICKPAIRSTARVGDLIFAFGSNGETPANPLVYIAEITLKLVDGEYYHDPLFQGRGDCIYERTSARRFRVRPNARFHGSAAARVRDLGNPPKYARANCLLSSNFRYLGREGTDAWKNRSPKLARLVESLRQGHRVVRDREIRDELLKLKQELWRAHEKKAVGKPRHAAEHPLVQIEVGGVGNRGCYPRKRIC